MEVEKLKHVHMTTITKEIPSEGHSSLIGTVPALSYKFIVKIVYIKTNRFTYK